MQVLQRAQINTQKQHVHEASDLSGLQRTSKHSQAASNETKADDSGQGGDRFEDDKLTVLHSISIHFCHIDKAKNISRSSPFTFCCVSIL